METARLCQQCQQPLPENAPEGLCPKCLAEVALGTEPATPGATLNVNPLAEAAPGTRVPPDPAQLAAQFPQLEILELLGMGGMGMVYQARQAAKSELGTRGAGPPPGLEPGLALGGYRIVRLLGQGGMGTVYEAEDSASGRRVALKVLSHSLESASARQRFLREGRLAASINHPNSVYIYAAQEINGTPVITMEYVSGGTLHDFVKNGGPMPVAAAVDAAMQMIAGLEAAAAKGVLHRDVKPSNCFVENDGTIKIGDFGLSISTLARDQTRLTMTGAILGTPAYSSPEQLRGDELDVRSDIYSVGATLYFLLTGRTPFQADNVVNLVATVLEKPAPPPRLLRPGIPKHLAQIVLRCLAKQPAQRFRNYEQLRQALSPFTSAAPTPARTLPPSPKSCTSPRSKVGGVLPLANGFADCALSGRTAARPALPEPSLAPR
jgi:serine/threonine protein kinase